MDRAEFIKERRQISQRRYDTMWAPVYDSDWGGYINPTHQAFITKLLEGCKPGGLILDAACGTGKYWPLILASGRRVYGIDQSGGMLAQANTKHPEVQTARLGLQELAAVNEYDAITCMDAMENVFPEDWPVIMANFHRALKPGGWLYFTVELPEKDKMDSALEKGLALGLPVVPGELAYEGSYHYYPENEKVRTWTVEAGFQILEEGEGDDYLHLLTRRD